jgi:hypothetical protein
MQREADEDYAVRCFIILIVTRYYYGDRNKWDEMAEVCSTHGIIGKFVEKFGRNT